MESEADEERSSRGKRPRGSETGDALKVRGDRGNEEVGESERE